MPIFLLLTILNNFAYKTNTCQEVSEHIHLEHVANVAEIITDSHVYQAVSKACWHYAVYL